MQNNSIASKFSTHIFLLFGAFMALIFAHEIVAQRLNNQVNQVKQSLLNQTYAFDWQFDQVDDVVSLFDSTWFNQDGNFGFSGVAAGISLNLRGRSIIKSIHQELAVTLVSDERDQTAQSMIVEFSNPDKGRFFYSKKIELIGGTNLIKLADLNWQTVDQDTPKATAIGWDQMQRLSTLVLRFSNINEQQIRLKQVLIPQSQPLPFNLEIVAIPCEIIVFDEAVQQLNSLCFNTNYMVALHHELALSGQIKLLNLQLISSYSPWVWLLLSWLCLLVAFMTMIDVSKNLRLVLAMVLVYSVVVLFHWQGFLQWQQWLRWPLLILSLLLLWSNRKVFNVSLFSAKYTWLLTALLSLSLFWISGFSLEFIQLLPMYLIWAAVQQILIGPIASDYVSKRIKINRHTAAMWVAFCFGLLHAPNHCLMLATLIGGYLWSYSWQKYRNIYVNIISHSLLALLFYQVMPNAWLGSARIGIFF